MDRQTQPANAPRPVRPLERIENLAYKVTAVTNRINDFAGRFHGGSPECATAPGYASDVIQVSYSSALERLAANLEALESAVEGLEGIG